MYLPILTILSLTTLGSAIATPGNKGSGGGGSECSDKHPENCPVPNNGVSASPAPTPTREQSSTAPVLVTSTYTTSVCSVTSAVPFQTSVTWYEQSCTQIPHTTVRTDYNLQWGCETSTVTSVSTMDAKGSGF